MLPLVVSVEQANGGVRRYAFAESPVSIGRSPFAELQLNEAFISRWEGTLRFDADEITYFSLGTTNATQLNGVALTAHEEDISVDVNAVLTLGELTLRFAREPVPETDLRRKGKRRPVQDDPAVAVKTVYLDGADAWAPVKVVLQANQPARPALAAEPALPLPAAAEHTPTSVTALTSSYREARARLIVAVRAKLAALPETERARWLAALQNEDPSLASDPDLQHERERLGLAPALEIPELRAWLQAIGRDVLPENLHFDSRETLTRILGLLEALVQSLAEIHDAQDSVRRRWLGQSGRRSVLQSDKGNLVLAYLLNPQADWNDRLRELEQSIRDVVTHELALFKATLEGARTLVEALSPQAITQAESVASEQEEAQTFWSRVLRKNSLEARLWQRLGQTHAELQDGNRYERVFLGRLFARSYLAAMGKSSTGGGLVPTRKMRGVDG